MDVDLALERVSRLVATTNVERTLAAEVERQRERIAELEAALRPFADCGKRLGTFEWPAVISPAIETEAFRAAAAAIGGAK